MKPTFTAISGSRALLDVLEDAIAEVKAGNISALGVVLCTTDNEVWLDVARVDDETPAWAMLVAGAATMQHELIAHGL